MKIRLSVKISKKLDDATKSSGYSKSIDTTEMSIDDFKEKYIEVQKSFIEEIKEAGMDLKFSSAKLNEFFDFVGEN